MKNNETHSLGIPGGGLMSSSQPTARARTAVSGLDRRLAAAFLRLIGNPRISLVLWNGEVVKTCQGSVIGALNISHRRVIFGLLLSPSRGFGDAYSAGDIEISGDFVAMLCEVYRGIARVRSSMLGRLAALLSGPSRTRGNTFGRARSNIHHHYDLGNEFYRLWLDERMVYTCAYYARPDMSLDEAQVAKLDHVCRKLDLQPGQTVLEVGCGWGALALHMAEHYGVEVHAYNISHQQIVCARDTARRCNLDKRVEFIEDDFRNASGKFDVFVSVGMLEHVGIERYAALGDLVSRTLRPTGRGLIHTIGRSRPARNNVWIERRIFPGSYPPSLSEMARIFEPHNFSILDVENLRLHYRSTCRDWLNRFEAASDEVARLYDEQFVRAWRLYLAGSTAAFDVGTLQLYQVLFTPSGNNDVPWTRSGYDAAIPSRQCRK